MNNAACGKSMENLRSRVDIRPVNNEKKYLKWTSKPIYVAQEIFDNDLVAIQKIKTTLTLNKPAPVGMCILELSKVLMYGFCYDYIEKKYGNKSRLLFTGTDSFMYEIETENVYGNFSKNKKTFDFNNYSNKSKYNDNSKAKLKMKWAMLLLKNLPD